VSVSLSGDLDAVHLSGDNANVLTTDAQKNTVYAFAPAPRDVEPEALALSLAEHFARTPITRARVTIDQYGWTRLGPALVSLATVDVVRSGAVVHDVDARGERRRRAA